MGDERVVAYCGAGISATLDAFALTLLGAPDVAVYDGSMSEWVADPHCLWIAAKSVGGQIASKAALQSCHGIDPVHRAP